MAEQFKMRRVWDLGVSSGRSFAPRAHVCVRGPSSDNGGHEWRRIGVVILDLSKLIPTFLVGKLQFHLQMDTALLLFFLSIFIQTFSRQGLVFTRGMIRVVKLHFGGINWIYHIPMNANKCDLSILSGGSVNLDRVFLFIVLRLVKCLILKSKITGIRFIESFPDSFNCSYHISYIHIKNICHTIRTIFYF